MKVVHLAIVGNMKPHQATAGRRFAGEGDKTSNGIQNLNGAISEEGLVAI